MDFSNLTNETVKNAISALDNNDKSAWDALFTDDCLFTDDGKELDFNAFFENAFQHKEKFLAFDKIENDGKNLRGDFFAGQWGTFNVFFNFHVNSESKIHRLDIGQTSKL